MSSSVLLRAREMVWKYRQGINVCGVSAQALGLSTRYGKPVSPKRNPLSITSDT